MTAIVLVTHCGLGESLSRQAEVIIGRLARMSTVSIHNGADPDQALSELVSALTMNSQDQEVIVLTDLPGATPHNLAVRAAQPRGVPVVSGVNLPMLLKVINHADKGADELAALAWRGGRQGILRS